MPFKTGEWGEQAKARSRRRREYFKSRERKKRIYSVHAIPKHGLGSFGEDLAIKILKGAVLIGKPCDILWENKKIDVKTSFPVQSNKNSKAWHFCLTRQRGIADYFLILCLDEAKQIIKKYLIPDSELKVNTLSIGINRSKYNKYLVRGEMM